MTPFEMFAAELVDTAELSVVLRPAPLLPESAAREVLVELAHADVRASGLWATSPSLWQRYDRPWNGPGGGPGDALLLGSVHVGYGSPTAYAITLYRASLTETGLAHDWTVEALVDEVLSLGGSCLATCPRATLRPSTRPLPVSA